MDRFAPERSLRTLVTEAARTALGVELEAIPLTYPPKPELGDLATPACFELGKRLKRPPRDVATAVVDAIPDGSGFARFEVAGPGFINAFLDRPEVVRRLLADGFDSTAAPSGPKVIVEHTNINPNKAAHIGHLRNAVLGDTLVRFLRQLGRPVEIQNYIDDTGVQVADLVVGFEQLRREGPAELETRYDEQRLREAGERFDYIAWDLYAEVTRFYEADESNKEHRRRTLISMEHGGNDTAELARIVARRMVQHHLMTMERIGVRYDLLPKESDILAMKFWEQAFERLKEAGAIKLTDAGKNAGCWVMDLAGAQEGAGEDQKVIVRSDGTVTYVGKDIAYQLWKFGLLGRDFRYRRFDWKPQERLYEIWETNAETDTADRPAFGSGETVYNVIDTRQSYLQRVVNQGLRALGHDAQADRSIHFSYEMVALTPAAVASMFPDYPLSDADRAKPYIEMAGRRGLGVRADDLIDALIDRARQEIGKRNPDMDTATIDATASRIAVGAMRYYMLRFSRNRVVAFDLDETLAFEGETGPYLQYSVVRARNILAKYEARFGVDSTQAAALAAGSQLEAVPQEAEADHWVLVQQLLRADSVIAQAVESLELSMLAKHAYQLAQTFNSFYHRYPVTQEEDETLRTTRVGLVRIYHDGLTRLLGLMGIEVPDRM